MAMTDGQIIVHQPQNVTSTKIVRDFVQVSFPSKVECDDAVSSLQTSVMRGLLIERWNILPKETHNFYKTCVEDSGRWKYLIVDLTQK